MPEVIELTVDSAMGERLRAAQGWVRVLDEDGNLIGNFKPTEVPPYDPASLPPLLSDEELQRRLMQSERFTTAEVLKKLQDL